MSPKKKDKYEELRASLEALPHVSPAQLETWVELQRTIDGTRDYLIRAVPQAQHSIDEAEKILAQRTYTLVFFGGTGVGKSTLINALLGRNLLPTGAVTAVTGTIVYIEQAAEDEAESLVPSPTGAATNSPTASAACASWPRSRASTSPTAASANRPGRPSTAIAEDGRENAKTERDEYLDILIDCIDTYESSKNLFRMGRRHPRPAPRR
jgi:hypothetical protein